MAKNPSCRFSILVASALVIRASATLSARTQQTTPASPAGREIQQPKGQWQKPGEIQQPKGTCQQPGEIQKPGQIQTVKERCDIRLRMGSDALFDFDKATLTSTAAKTLADLGPMIAKAGTHPVVIEGHTDSVGTDPYNNALSEKRAAAVRTWLTDHGSLTAQTPIKGYGKSKPVAPNRRADGSDNPEGRALNRRVEIVIDTCK